MCSSDLSDRVLRRLEAMLLVLDKDQTFLLSGNGDLIEPDDEVAAIGSGGPYALAAARALVAHSAPQHVMWVAENANGSRGFGFTGGHYHAGWANDDQRKLVLNAIAWAAHVDVPADGITTKTPTDDEMKENLDPKGK